MNIITKHPVNNLGYNFVDQKYLPAGEDEYYLRNKQNKNNINYRKLSSREKEILIRNDNSSDDWSKIFVSDAFDPVLVKNCKFFGLIRIGKLEPYYLEFHNLRMPVGIYNSTIISCDFGDNICIDNAHYLSHYIIGNEVMIANVNELAATDYSKFGNGILKEGETELTRIWMEVRNETGGRRVIPFESMLPGDAYLWSSNRDDKELLERFIELTQKEFALLEYLLRNKGKVCRRTRIIEKVWDVHFDKDTSVIDVFINSLRKKLDTPGKESFIQTIRGVGYRVNDN